MSRTIEDVLEMWKIDAVIDDSKLDTEIIKIPMLHSKYLEYYIFFKKTLSSLESKKNKLSWVKRKYFRGEFNADDLKKHGWSQWNSLKPSSSELSQLLEFDQDLVDINRAIAEMKTSIAGVEYIFNQLKAREYSLKTVFEYRKYLGGN